MLKALTAGAVAGLLVLSTAAMAAGDTVDNTAAKNGAVTQGALAPGKAASVKEAQWVLVNGHWVWLVGGAFVIAGAALAVSGNGNGSVSTTTTTAALPN